MLIHRRVFTQVSSPVINWAQGRLFTGLNPQKCVTHGKFHPQQGSLGGGKFEEMRRCALKRTKQTGTNCLSVNSEGLFTDAEAGKDPAEQIIRAERPGNFPQQLLGLP